MLSSWSSFSFFSAVSASSQKVDEGCSLDFAVMLAWVSALVLSSWIALGKLLNFLSPTFIIYKMRIQKFPLLHVVTLRQN